MVGQAHFAKALLDPGEPTPDRLSLGGGSADQRFSIYRNNGIAGLSDILMAHFPVLTELLGEEYCRSLVVCYIRQYPPHSPILTQYGRDMPVFLAAFPPVARYPYLPDIAAMELALMASYHAKDSRPVEAEILSSIPDNAVSEARLVLAPSVQPIISLWPIYQIWMSHRRGQPMPTSLKDNGENILIVRREFDPEPLILVKGGFEFVTALQKRQTISEAYERASAIHQGFDLTKMLRQLLAFNAITHVQHPDLQETR